MTSDMSLPDRAAPTSTRRLKARDWLVVIGLSFAVGTGLGFARFSYALILPAMQADLAWSYTQAGWINTANAIGYIAGCIIAFCGIGPVSPNRLFSIGAVGTALGILATGLTDDFVWLSVWRAAAGLFAALAIIAGSACASALFKSDARRNALAIALFFGGGGIGMAIGGALLPPLFATFGDAAWREAWIILGLISLASAAVSLWAADTIAQPTTQETSRSGADTAHPKRTRLPILAMLPELVGYFGFALGYIVYATFLIAWMRAFADTPLLEAMVFMVFGLAVVVSPFLWKSVLAKNAGGVPLALATALCGLGTVLCVLVPNTLGIAMSAVIFGLAVFMAPTAVSNFSKKNFEQADWGRAMALLTGLFAIGQTIAPVAAGAIGDAFGNIQFGLIAAAQVLAVSALITLFQKPIRR